MNQAKQDGDDDSLLDEFFAAIENIKIHDEKDDDDDEEIHNGRTSKISQSHYESPLPPKKQQQKSMIDRAETTKNNWKQFVIQESSLLSPPPSSLDAPGRKPISFSIGAGAKSKKKRNTKKSRSKITKRQTKNNETESETTTTSFAFDAPCVPQRNDHLGSLSQNDFILPQWIAVLDTCAIIESYESVCDMIQLARDAVAASNNKYTCHHPSSSINNKAQSHTKFGSLQQPLQGVLEALTIVVPYTVWDELDYRSKAIDDEHQRYKARRAARMLTDELRKEQQVHDWQQHRMTTIGTSLSSSPLSQSDASATTTTPSMIRSQSRIDSHRAVEEFVLLSTTIKAAATTTTTSTTTTTASKNGVAANNDDRILACALWEQDRFVKSQGTKAAAVGGVVLITSDKVLTGKARADGLSVYSPSEFVRYYNKRMASLQSRASATNKQRL